MAPAKIFFASVEYLQEMLGFILSEAKKTGFQAASLNQLELASEEAIVNIIHHAYQDRGGEIEIALFSEPQKKIVIIISDGGIPFNPLTQMPLPDLSGSLEEREIGGLGLLFMRKYLDEIAYERQGDWNVLTLVKKLPS